MTAEQNDLKIKDQLQVFTPEVVVLPAQEADEYGWSIFDSQIRSKPDSTLTLATGSSPLGIYNLWIAAYRKGLDCSKLIINNLDEYVGLPKNHPQSYAQFMNVNLFDRVNVSRFNRFIPDSSAKDPYDEAVRYQKILDRIGPSDLTILGIGPKLTCHIAFNERGSSINSHTRVVKIYQETIDANSRFFNSKDEVPTMAITQGIADILKSKKIILVAKGLGKAQGIQRTLEGPINSGSPASFLRLHPNVVFVLDQEAASLLSN